MIRTLPLQPSAALTLLGRTNEPLAVKRYGALRSRRVTLSRSPGFTFVGSSFAIVPVPVQREIGAPLGLLRLTVNVSSGSFVVSPLTVTFTVLLVSPGANVTVPLLAT